MRTLEHVHSPMGAVPKPERNASTVNTNVVNTSTCISTVNTGEVNAK